MSEESNITLEDYVRILNQYQELQQENQQLKEDYSKLLETSKAYKKLLKTTMQKEHNATKVLDEIREYIKEHNDYLEKAKEMYIGCNDELLKSTCIQLINNELVRSDNLLQILDKVKE